MADVQKLPGGAPTQSEILVNADQETVVGDGSIGAPLRAPTSFVAIAQSSIGALQVVTPAVANVPTVNPCPADGSAMVGIALTAAGTGAEVEVQYAGIVTGTIAEWHAVGASSAGLNPGSQYYLSQSTAGDITTVAPTHPDVEVTVGIALTPTQLLITRSFSVAL